MTLSFSRLSHPLLEALAPVALAVGAELVEMESAVEGDITLYWEGVAVGAFRLPGLQGAMSRLLSAVEREMGKPLSRLSREDKQRVVRQLDQAGAFALRKAVEDVADALGVSRFTVYNYLNSVPSGESSAGQRQSRDAADSGEGLGMR